MRTSVRGDLAEDHDKLGAGASLAGNVGILVLGKARVDDGVGHLCVCVCVCV